MRKGTGLWTDSDRRAHLQPANPPIPPTTRKARLSKPAASSSSRDPPCKELRLWQYMPIALRFAMPSMFMLNGISPATFSYASCAMLSPPGMPPSPGEPKPKAGPLATIFIP